MQSRFLRRRGFSLLEVLLVIAILGLLVSLSLPAIQAAREAARRTQCTNHLRQFGLALAGFEGQNRVFPAAFTARIRGPLASKPELQIHGFMSDLLPFLEEKATDAQYHRDVMFCAPGNALAIATPIAIGLCPTTPEREEAPTTKFMPSLLLKPSDQKSTGVAGPILDLLDSKYGTAFAGAISDYTLPAHADRRMAEKMGYTVEDKVRELPSMFPMPEEKVLMSRLLPLLIGSSEAVLGDRLRATQIKDGLQRTMAMFEAAGRPQHWVRGVRNPLKEPLNSAWADPRILIKLKFADYAGADRLINDDNNNHAYSFHSGGANFLFADAHVQFLSEDSDARIIVAFMTPDQGDNDLGQ